MTDHPVWQKYNDAHRRVLDHLDAQPHTGCINWTGPTLHYNIKRQNLTTTTPNKQVRPYMYFLGHRYSPRRFMFELTVRKLLDPAIILRTTCRNPLCVNPDHVIEVISPSKMGEPT